MKRFFKLSVTCFFFIIVLIGKSNACMIEENNDWQEYKEVIDKRFTFNTSTPEFIVDNAYGDITIVSSDRRDAEIEVTITVEAKNKSRADDIFDRIEIDFDKTTKGASARTSIKFNGGWTKRHEKYKIDYNIALPQKAFLDIENRYGDVSLSDHNNDVEVVLKYGSGSLQNILGDLKVNLGYADRFNVGSVSGDLKAKVSYSHLSVDGVQNVDCISSYSDVSIEESVLFEADSKYDDYSIGKVAKMILDDKYSDISISEVGDFNLDMAYSSVKIKSLSRNGMFDTSYGSVEIRNVETTTDEIDIESGHTGIRIGYNGGMTLDIETKYTDVRYPDSLDIKYRDKDNNELNLKGSVKGTGNLKLTAKMKYGSLKIRE